MNDPHMPIGRLPPGQPALRPGHRRRAVLIAAAVLAALLPRLLSIFTESINWDEFALLHRVEQTLLEGRVVGGGRPGLVNMVLLPFVRGCTDVIDTAVRARLLWLVITSLCLFGVFILVRNWFRFARRTEAGNFEASVAVALLAFLPAFVAWSIQVRTDQAALAAATCGGALLLSERNARALPAGVLFGLAILFTQKGVYVAALAGLLWASAIAGRLCLAEERGYVSELRDRFTQALIALAGAVAVIGTYAYLVPSSENFTSTHSLAGAWDSMRRVREIVGYRAYRTAALQSLPHLLLLAALLAASVRAVIRRNHPATHLLATSWAVLFLGTVVAVLHGSSWAYFLMTLGLFVAVALGLAAGHLAQYLAGRRQAIVGLLLAVLVLGSVPTTIELLQGSQANQRDTIEWIEKSGLGAYRGYQVDGALVCMSDPDPIPPMSHRLNMGRLSATEANEFTEQFRRRPVAYLLDADLLGYFPAEVVRFWEEHYRWYYGSAFVAGFRIKPAPRAEALDVIVPGPYRWIPMPPHKSAVLEVNGEVVQAGQTVQLTAGQHMIATRPDGAGGALTLALREPPGNRLYPFMDPVQRERLVGLR